MALSPEYLEYADGVFDATVANERHYDKLAQIRFQNQINEYAFMFMTVAVIGLLYWLVWIAVDNWTSYRITDDFERIDPPPIDWDKVQ